MITHLDHVALVTRELDQAYARYCALLGRAATWQGQSGGVAHVYFDLEATALDVIAPVGQGPAGDNMRSVIDRQGEGLWALAFASDDLQADRQRLDRVGISNGPDYPVRTTDPNTRQSRAWQTSVINPDRFLGVQAFLIGPSDTASQPLSALQASEPAAAVTGLDHVVIETTNPERAAALYGARLGLSLRLDRTHTAFNRRFLFFKCGETILEVVHDLGAGSSDGHDKLWGLTWRVPSAGAAQARLASAGFDVSDVRPGRKPGTKVFTVRDAPAQVPTLILSQED